MNLAKKKHLKHILLISEHQTKAWCSLSVTHYSDTREDLKLIMKSNLNIVRLIRVFDRKVKNASCINIGSNLPYIQNRHHYQ